MLRFSTPCLLVFGLVLPLSPPANAQNSTAPASAPTAVASPSAPASSPAPAVRTSQAPRRAPDNTIPLLLGAFGCVLGAGALGLSYLFFQSSQGKVRQLEFGQTQMDEKQRRISLEQQNLNDSVEVLRRNIPDASKIEGIVVTHLVGAQAFNRHLTEGESLREAVKSVVAAQTREITNQDVKPHIQALTANAKAKFDSLDEKARKSDEQLAVLKERFEALPSEIKDQFDTFAFNVYNLLYAQSHGDPARTELEKKIDIFTQLHDQLKELSAETTTEGTLRQFAEVNAQLREKLDLARRELASEAATSVLTMRYLGENDKANALLLLEEYRLQVRQESIGALKARESLDDTALKFSGPLETLFMGATISDRENPFRNIQHTQLLQHIQAAFEAAGIFIYAPKPGETLEVEWAEYEFEDTRHGAPFVVSFVERPGLRVGGKIEKARVIVA